MPDLGKRNVWISIHALLAESDDCVGQVWASLSAISIHALLAESDTAFQKLMAALLQFLSTLSLRRATHSAGPWQGAHRDFYPRSPCGERLLTEINKMATGQISIHALLAESDTLQPMRHQPPQTFLSTLSLRRATALYSDNRWTTRISIHALLAESDRLDKPPPLFAVYFYPRSPCGERLFMALKRINSSAISIHALLAESDRHIYYVSAGQGNFYPRSPCGERHYI